MWCVVLCCVVLCCGALCCVLVWCGEVWCGVPARCSVLHYTALWDVYKLNTFYFQMKILLTQMIAGGRLWNLGTKYSSYKDS